MKRAVSVLLVLLILITSIPMTAFADEVRFGVSPSFKNNIQMEKNKPITYEFRVSNTSILTKATDAAGDLIKQKDYTFTIHLSAGDLLMEEPQYKNLTEDEKNQILPSRWISFDKDSFEIQPDKQVTFKGTIEIPENADPGEHVILIRVTRDLLKGVETSGDKNVNISVSPTIEVPVFVSVLGENGDGLEYDYKIKDMGVTDGIQVTPLKGIIRGLFVFDSGWKNRFYDLLYKPYKISYSDKIIYDIPSPQKTTLTEVSVTDRALKDAMKYVVIPADMPMETKVDRLSFDKNLMRIASGELEYTIEFPNEAIANDVKMQVTSLAAQIKLTPTVQTIFDNVSMNKNVAYADIKFYINYTIENTGTKTIVPSGTLEIFNVNNQKVDVSMYQYTIIMPKLERQIYGEIKYDPIKLLPGEYTIQSAIVPYEGATPIVEKSTIVIKNMRVLIWVGMGLTALLSLVLAIVVLRLLVLLLMSKLGKRDMLKSKKKMNAQLQDRVSQLLEDPTTEDVTEMSNETDDTKPDAE